MESETALDVNAARSLFSEWISTREASMSKITEAVPVVADERDHLSAHLGHYLGDTRTTGRGELVEGPAQGCVRRNRAEQIIADAQMLDIETALAAPGQHESALDQDLAPVVNREAATPPWQARQQ
jgi:hypothetical protein